MPLKTEETVPNLTCFLVTSTVMELVDMFITVKTPALVTVQWPTIMHPKNQLVIQTMAISLRIMAFHFMETIIGMVHLFFADVLQIHSIFVFPHFTLYELLF